MKNNLYNEKMRTRKRLFSMPSNISDAYLMAVADVRKEMGLNKAKKGNTDYKKGWNECLTELDKRIRIKMR